MDKKGESFLRRLQIIGRELIVSKTLRKPITEYTKLFPHVSVAINLTQRGKVVTRGETIDFVYVNTRRHNPLRRVAPIELYGTVYYASEKYKNMILTASETILSTYGFSR